MSQPNAKILVVEGGRELVLPFMTEEMWLGRAPECSLRVDDALVSRKHAVLRRLANAFVIEDLVSANGTFVNDQRVSGAQPIAQDDVIRCGEVVVRLMLDEAMAVADEVVVSEPEASPELSIVELESAPTLPMIDLQPAPAPAVVVEPAPAPAVVEPASAVVEPAPAPPVSGRLPSLEVAALQRRVEDLLIQLADSEERRNEDRIAAEDLQAELARTRAEAAKVGERLETTREALASRDRRVAQADAEIAKLKTEVDRQRVGAAELARTQDVGLAQANAVMHEAEQLREVIRQQVALLEERRVEILVLRART